VVIAAKLSKMDMLYFLNGVEPTVILKFGY